MMKCQKVMALLLGAMLATRGSWHRYWEQGRYKGLLASLLGASSY